MIARPVRLENAASRTPATPLPNTISPERKSKEADARPRLKIDGPPVGRDPRDGKDRPRHRRRQQPPDPDRRRRRGARPVPAMVRGGGADHGPRRDGQHVRPPRGRRPRGAAGLCRLPPRHAAHRRALRRRAGHAERAGDRPHAQRSGDQDQAPIVVTNWTNEEGTRFAPAMLASGVFAGVHAQTGPRTATDAEGRRFGDELDRIGWKGEEEVGARPMHAFFELHIEQGPILEAEGKDVGVVTHGQGLWWTAGDGDRQGKPHRLHADADAPQRGAGHGADHRAGARDRLENQPDAVGAVGQANVYPNSRNVIPGRAVFTVDFRSPRARRDLGHGGAAARRAPEDLRRDGPGGRVREGRRLRPR